MAQKHSPSLGAAFVLLFVTAFTHAADAPVARPNIIFLMDDQHRWDALGIVNSSVKTPNLDALAKSGIFYDQAVCQTPMCTPSRNSMMLGLYPNQSGVLRNGRTGIPDGQLPSRPLAESFRDAGYQTAGFGKTHWGVVCSTRGFETRYVGECFEKNAVMMIDDAPEAKKRYDAESKTMGGGEENNLGYLGFTSPLPEKEHRDGWVTGKCLDFIDSRLDPERPLFLYLSFLKPHAGHNVPAGYEKQYDLSDVEYAKQPPWTEDRSPHAAGINRRDMYIDYWSKATDEQWRLMTMRYRANCTWIDDMFGRVLRKLKQKGVLDHAIIVYCSDHGEMLGERYYRFNKYCLYESSVRVPLVLSGSAIPEQLRGTRDHRPAELVDLYPTLLDAAGIKVSQRAVGLNLLDNEKRPASFCAFHEHRNEAAFMWRTADHKLILKMKRRADDEASRYVADDVIGGEFYNLDEDPQEWHDLYSDPAAPREIRDKMTKELLEFLKSQHRLTGFSVAEAGDLTAGFADPPVSARPGAYWCWLNGNVTHAQITRDLEEMKAKGMGGAEIWDVQALRNSDNFVPAGPAFLSEQSLESIAHAIREGTRLNLRLGLIASSGWNAGGSWVPPKYAGKGLFWSQTAIEGPAKIEQVLRFPTCDRAPKQPDGMPVFYKEIAVLAVPADKTLRSIDNVVDVSRHMDADGRLKWNAPEGKWTILRFVCSNHGQRLIVPSPKSNGIMIDFIDPTATEFHLKYMMDKILAKLGRKDFRGTALKFMEFDSMELERGVLWSDNFAKDFARLRGYSPIQYLPLLAGWKLAEDDLNNRFRYDVKLAVSDQLIFSHYVTGSKLLREYGLVLVAEAGGPGPPIWNSCPVDAIKALGAVDVPRGEFWIANRNMFLIKEIASASHVYGKKLVDAESFTTWRRWIDGPVAHKRLADRALCEGLNHFTFHTFASSPPEAGVPGRAYHAGTDINTTTTWWPKAKPFMDYLSRCAFMLRQGLCVADVCVYYGDQAPNFYPTFHSVPRKIVPESLGLGYDYDVCDTQSILTRMRVEGGRIVLPDGMSYAIMALPEQDFMPLSVLQKIEKLVAAGATVVGPKPVRSTGLHAATTNDATVKRVADKLWGKCDGKTVVVNRYGKGRTVWGPSWRDVLAGKGIGPDFHVVNEAERDNLDYIHRRTADREIYFVRNKTMASKTLDCVFRVKGGKLRYWNPVSGKIEHSGAFEAVDGGTKVSLTLPPAGSVFVVFSEVPADLRIAAAEGVTYLNKSNRSPALELEGPWRLGFSKRFGAPESTVFDKLTSWTDSPDPAVKFFSGVVTYEKTFDLPASTAEDAPKLTLDLGDVKEVAEVYVNGRSVGVVWAPPYRVDISAAAEPGENELKVEVINLLANRLIGDQAYPAGGRHTKSNIQAFRADSPLLPSGLLGPVRVFAD